MLADLITRDFDSGRKEQGDHTHTHNVQTGSGAHPASYPMGSGDSFRGGKSTGARSWPFTPIYCRGQRMRGAIPPFPQLRLYGMMLS